MEPDPLSITGEQCLLDKTEQEPDSRPSIHFRQVFSNPSSFALGDFASWSQKHKESLDVNTDVGFENFRMVFDNINLNDMKEVKTWLSDVKAILRHAFELLVYVFCCHGGRAGDDGAARPKGVGELEAKFGAIPLLEVWEFCRNAALSGPGLGIREIDEIMPDHRRARKNPQALHSPVYDRSDALQPSLPSHVLPRTFPALRRRPQSCPALRWLTASYLSYTSPPGLSRGGRLSSAPMLAPAGGEGGPRRIHRASRAARAGDAA